MEQRFERLVDQHGGRLLQLARLILRSQAEAEDAVQDCLVKLWDHLARLNDGQELAWLVTCTRNACLDRLRTQQRRGELMAQRAECLIPSEPALSPDHSLAAELRALQLHSAIAALPEPGRSLLILRDIQDMDVAEVAQALSLSANQVKVYNFRARRALRMALEADTQFEEAAHESIA